MPFLDITFSKKGKSTTHLEKLHWQELRNSWKDLVWLDTEDHLKYVTPKHV